MRVTDLIHFAIILVTKTKSGIEIVDYTRNSNENGKRNNRQSCDIIAHL